MSLVEPTRTVPSFIPVPCPCGRLLRAKSEMVGAEIECWDCHKMVVVPFPRQPGQAGRALAEGWGRFARGRTFASILGATTLVVLSMMIPRFGLVGGGVALAVVAVALLGRAVDRASRGDLPGANPGRGRVALAAVAWGVLGALMAAGTVIPLWGMNYRLHQSPRWNAAGMALFAITWFAFPIASLMTFGRDRRGRLGVRNGLRLLARHPMLTLLALAIVPSAVVVSEAVLVGGTLHQGSFSFLALDLLPMPGKPEVIDGLPMYNMVDFRSYPMSRYLKGYWDALGRGYTLTGSLPASLSMPTTHDLNSHALHLLPRAYWAFRGFCSGVAVAILLAAATLQACWLGAMAAVDHRRVV